MRMLVFAVLMAGLTTAAPGASFDCAKAATPVEKLICADDRLSALDSDLSQYYSAARATLGEGGQCLREDQRQWLRAIRNRCASADCLLRVYRERLVELSDLQPGATLPLGSGFPKVKRLAWMLPPAEDEVAAPRNQKRGSLTRAGKMIDDTADGDGFALLTDDGVKHPVLMLMFMNKASAVPLEGLTGEAAPRVEVRGQAERSSDGVDHFAPGACISVYRLPGE
jgi:uncharacterized protein